MRMVNACCMAGLVAACPVAATAQSNVTVYGRLDASLNLQRYAGSGGADGATHKAVSSDTSFFGLRGTEDLGDGWRASFKIEHGFQIDTGAASNPGKFWNRESLVGLGHAQYGTVLLGSQFTPAIVLSRSVDPFIRSNNGAFLSLLQGTRGFAVQYDNAIQYLTPDWGGFSGRLMVAAGEGGPGRSYALSADYRRGALYIGVSADQIELTGASIGLPERDRSTSRTTMIGATYDFGVARLHGWLQSNRTDGLSRTNGAMVGATVPIGPGEIRAAYTARRADGAKASLAALGYFHLLSKRTTLYASLARLDNDATTAFGMWPSRLDLPAPAAGQDITGVQVGMRHLF